MLERAELGSAAEALLAPRKPTIPKVRVPRGGAEGPLSPGELYVVQANEWAAHHRFPKGEVLRSLGARGTASAECAFPEPSLNLP